MNTSYKEDHSLRFVLDLGSWNFRFWSNKNNKIFHMKSRIGKVSKNNQINLFSEDDYKNKFIDEADSKFLNIFTKSVLTDFESMDNLFEKYLEDESITNEKRFLKNCSLSLYWKPFTPTRASCNFMEYCFEILGIGSLSMIPLGKFFFNELEKY